MTDKYHQKKLNEYRIEQVEELIRENAELKEALEALIKGDTEDESEERDT